MKRLILKIIRGLAMKYGCLPGFYRKFCQPSDEEWAQFLGLHGNFEAIGRDCSIVPTAVITDPALVRIGNNVRLSACALIAHDGVIAMLNKAYGVKLDSVGRIDIRDNVFIGYGAIGIPAKPVGKVSALLEKLKAQTARYPWASLIQQRDGAFDAALEPELLAQRIVHFWRETDAGSIGVSS